MRRLIIPIALLALAGCGDRVEVRYVVPTTTKPSSPLLDLEQAALDAAWEEHRADICAAIDEVGGLTPAIEEAALDAFRDGTPDYDLTPAGEDYLLELLRSC